MISHEEKQRQEFIERLIELGMLNIEYTMTAWEKLTAVGQYPGQSRLAIFERFSSEGAKVETGKTLTYWQRAALALLYQFDLYGLEDLVKDAQEFGVPLTYARLLESAFQYATKIGTHYDLVEELAADSLSGGVSWKRVYVVLTWDKNWNPF